MAPGFATVKRKLPVDAFRSRFFTSCHSILYDAPVSSGAAVTITTSVVGLGLLGFGAGARCVVSRATFPGARRAPAAARKESAVRSESAARAESLGGAAPPCVLSHTIADCASFIGTALESEALIAKSEASMRVAGSSGLSKRTRSVTESVLFT